jgi:hypothetical protein
VRDAPSGRSVADITRQMMDSGHAMLESRAAEALAAFVAAHPSVDPTTELQANMIVLAGCECGGRGFRVVFDTDRGTATVSVCPCVRFQFVTRLDAFPLPPPI